MELDQDRVKMAGFRTGRVKYSVGTRISNFFQAFSIIGRNMYKFSVKHNNYFFIY